MNKFEKIIVEQYCRDTCCLDNCADYEDLKLPVRATQHSAGYDIFSPVSFVLKPNETIRIPTGIRVILDENKFLLIAPRSGLGCNFRLQLDNTIAVIDADYCNSNNKGHIWIKLTNDSKKGDILNVSAGDAIAQGIILEYSKTVDDNAIGIRNGGFGSTSK